METGLIDLDVHPSIKGTTDVLFPYMPSAWQKRFEARATWPLPGAKDNHRMPHIVGRNIARLTAMPPGGGPAASDPKFLAKDLLDRFNIEAALLMPIEASNISGLLDHKEASVFASAFNDYLVDKWLGSDERFRLAIAVAPQDPVAAAAEINRMASTRGVAGVYFPLTDVPIASPYLEPILAAAHDADLPLCMHVNSTFGLVGAPTWGGWMPNSYAQMYSILSHHAQGAVANLIWEGTFEKFPRLRVVFVEYGWSWVPSMMWHMDAAYKTARRTMPWVKRPPSEYIREHVRFTSEPALEVPSSAWENDILQQMGADRTLCFSTDYPHWDSDDPDTVFKRIAPDLRRRIFRENAIETFGERMISRQLQPAR